MLVFWQFDFPVLLIGLLSVIACTLTGNFLLVRQQSMVSDAISHIVFPGIVGGYLIAGNLDSWTMLIGAVVASILAIIIFELIHKLITIDNGAMLGLVFSAMFAIGVLMLELSDARSVHLDVEHALAGNLESAIWLSGTGFYDLFNISKLSDMPPSTLNLIITNIIILSFIIAFYKELKLTSFDNEYGMAIGLPTGIINFALMVLTAITAVAAFDAVGSILVVAMFICPPATARLLTDSLSRQIVLSIIFAVLSVVIGYLLAIWLPLLWGSSNNISAAGMIAVTAGLFQMVVMSATVKSDPIRQTKIDIPGS